MNPSVDLPSFQLPPDIHYECHMDGDCCRDFWEIQVDPASVARIEDMDWRAHSGLAAAAPSPFEPSRADPSRMKLRRVGRGCHFLGEDRLCRLHAAHGLAIKPRACRRFPFRYTRTPDGLNVGVSFACPVVVDDEGPSVESQRADVVAEYASDPEPDRAIESVRLDAGTPMKWETYRAVESALDAILARDDGDVARGLIAGHAWLGMLSRFIEELRREAEARGEPPPDADESAKAYMERTRKDEFQLAFRVADRPAASPALKRMLIGTFVAFRGALRPGQGRLTTAGRLAWLNLRHFLRVGALRLPPHNERVPWREMKRASSDLDDPAFQDVLRRYFRHAVFRKDLAVYPDLMTGYGFMALAYALIQWHVTAHRALGAADPRDALCLVEKFYVHHSNFNLVILRAPATAGLFQRLLTAPNIVHTLTRG